MAVRTLPRLAVHAAATRKRLDAVEAILDREYKRDSDGKFTSGSGPEWGHPDGDGMHSHAAIRAAFDFDDEQTGMSARVTGTRPSPGGQVYVDVEIRNRDGQMVGSAIRTLSADGKTVSHSGMATNPDFGAVHGQGFATRLNAQAEAEYRRHGVEKITLTASSSVGGYAWARAGYDFQNAAVRGEIAARARARKTGKDDTVRDYDEQTMRDIARVANNPRSTPLEFAMIGWTPGAKTWPGKDIMLGSMWEGVKYLDD